MSTHVSSQTATAQPAHVLQVLTDPASCGRPVRLEVAYQLTPAAPGTLIEAQITLSQGGGITGALVSRATNAMLGAGALRFALRAIAAEAEQLQQAAGQALPFRQKWRAA